tara:strand:+ start:216 stop:632 length:417 start_codon:yes stop_codon:yes gene_type:complete
MNWKDIKYLIREELNEETNVTADNTTFIMRTGVNKNPTKLGLKIQFTPKEGALDNDTKARLAQVLQSKLNESLRQFNLQASIDTDVPNPEVVGFMIPLMQIKNMIVKAIGGSNVDSEPETVSEPETPSEPEAQPGDEF